MVNTSIPDSISTNIFTDILNSISVDPDSLNAAKGAFKEFKKSSDLGLIELLSDPQTSIEDILAVTPKAISQKPPRDLTKPNFGTAVDYVIRTDGACPGNSGPMGLGIAVFSNNGDAYEKGYSLVIDNKDGTNQKAEILALVVGLHIGLSLSQARKTLRFELDSEYVVKTMNGEYGISDKDNAKLFMLAGFLRQQYDQSNVPAFHSIYREWNQEADYLSNEALGFPDTTLMAPISAFQSTLHTLSDCPDIEENIRVQTTVPILRKQLEKMGIEENKVDEALDSLFKQSNLSIPREGQRISPV